MAQEYTNLNYKLFFDLHVDLLLVCTLEGVFIKANTAWKNTLGYAPEELLGTNFRLLLHPDDVKALEAGLEGATVVEEKDDDETITGVTRYRHKDGHYVYLQWNTHIIDNVIYGSGRNVTTFRDREEELRKNQLRLQAMLESQTSYLMRLDLDFKYNFANKKYLEEFAWIHGTTDLVGISCEDSILPESIEANRDLLNKCIAEPGTPYQVEILKPSESGMPIITLWDCVCLTNSEGKPVEIQCLGINITERRELENQEKLAQESALLEMSTPITQLWDGILLLPLVGMVTAQRAQSVMSSVLKKIADTQSKVLILDISGVPVVDTAVANHFIKLSKATRLMGCACTMSGISPAVSQTIVDLGIQIEEINTTGTMKDALEKGLASTGSKLISIKDYNALKNLA